jgi:hypothetical protein
MISRRGFLGLLGGLAALEIIEEGDAIVWEP